MPHENVAMMDAGTTKYGNQTFVTLSRPLAVILLVLFFVCLIATGLLVYSFTSCSNTIKPEESNRIECPTVAEASRIFATTTTTEENTVTLATEIAVTELNVLKTDLNVDLDVRLPNNVLPHSYEIKLIPFLQENNFTFRGQVKILVNVTEDVSSVTLHSVQLNIHTTAVYDTENNTVSVRDVRKVQEKDFLVIELDGQLLANSQYYIFIEFDGILNKHLEGFYRSSYVEKNITRWIASTQFQATDARKAFPCFDEPAMKAKFQINIARTTNMTSLSNMRKINSSLPVENLPGYVWDQFEESVPMSTYLIAFVVSDFESITDGNFSVWARPSALSQARYSLEIGPKILKFYEEFFGIEYPLKKLDMVAIPDFSSGAMENWGLITYREPLLLHQEGVSSSLSLRGLVHVVAHELAHQWFGNLVTPSWWEDLWLNEGFATYVEYLGTDSVAAQWKEQDLFVVEQQTSLALDALKNSHPISVTVRSPDEVSDIFDEISYSKGASIIRMMQNFMTPEVFHRGLNKYLRNRLYSSADQDDLWSFFTAQSHEDGVLAKNITIKEIMDTWTLQTGFPVVSVTQESDIYLSMVQERFLLQGSSSRDESLWWIPITYTDDKFNFKRTWMEKTKKILMERNPALWYLINVNVTGYYRVNYDVENWRKITDQLLTDHRVIDSKNRAQLLDDSLNLAYAGYVDYGVALNITKYLVNETEYVPWEAALTNLDFLHAMFIRSSRYEKYKEYMLSLLVNMYHELGFKESKDDALTAFKRVAILDRTCTLGFKDCVRKAVVMFQNWKNSADPDQENPIPPDLRQIVYCTAIRDGGEEEWDFAWQRYLKNNVASEKELLLSSLGCTQEIWLLYRYLEWSLTEESGIRKHDISRVFGSVAKNPIGRDLAYKFMKTQWSKIRDYLGPSSLSISGIVSTCTEKFNTQEDVNDFKAFFERKYDEVGFPQMASKQSIEQAEANVKWMENHFDSVTKWLSLT